jgi:hypothetical protein
MKTQQMTVKEIVNTIPARLGLNENQLDLSTPEKAYEFLRDTDFQIFAQSDNSNHIFDSAPCSLVILETGYKSMYDANNLFAAENPKREELQKKYGVTESWVADFAVDDEDGYLEYATWPEENLHFVSDNNWPFRLGFGEFGKFDEFVELVRKICVANNDWAKISVIISDETYNSIDISADGTIVNSLEYKIIDNKQKEMLFSDLLRFKINIIDYKKYDNAQVCSGGVSLLDINIDTMESKHHKNFYIIGELLDVDGDCGGYNLGFAWLSGILAGDNIRSIYD